MKKKIDYTKYKVVNRSPLFVIASTLLYLILLPILYFIKLFIFEVRIKNRKIWRQAKKQHKGMVIVSNHILGFDAPMIATAIAPRRMYILSLESNFYIPVAGTLIRMLRGIPVPQDIHYTSHVFNEIDALLKRGKIMLVFPEGHIEKRCDHLRKFHNGAFRMAIKADVPIQPVVYTYRGKNNRKLTLHFLPTVYAKEGESHAELNERVKSMMDEVFTAEMEKERQRQLAKKAKRARIFEEEEEEVLIEPIGEDEAIEDLKYI